MKLNLRTSGRLGVKEQIKSQLRSLIARGEYRPGQALPSSRDLALTLGVNRNTAWAAYRELSEEGLLTSGRGAGTFVNKDLEPKETAAMEDLIRNLFSRAGEMGFSMEEVCDHCLGLAARLEADIKSARVLVVECNLETGREIAASLLRELGITAGVRLIQDVEQNPEQALELVREMDLIVCGFNHLAEFRAALPRCPVESVGVILAPDLKALNRMQAMPRGSRVGITCVNQRSSETLCKNLPMAGGSTLTKIWAGQDAPDKLGEMLASCRVIFATHPVYRRVVEMAVSAQEVVRLEIKLDPGGVELVRERLAEIMRGRAK